MEKIDEVVQGPFNYLEGQSKQYIGSSEIWSLEEKKRAEGNSVIT